MLVTKNTKISQLIKEKPQVVDVIASINKHFKKLKNPILRKVLASRVTVEDAAKVGGVSLQFFFEKLMEVGFEIDYENGKQKNVTSEKQKSNNSQKKSNVITLDVRPIIESGKDPFKEIMELVKSLGDDETLQIINSFEPIPLINNLKKKGFSYSTTRPKKGEVHTFFKKEKITAKVQESTTKNVVEKSVFKEKLSQFGTNIKNVDVRLMEMPEPMTTILQAIEDLPIDFALLVEHKKIPQFLLPELEERNYEVLFNKISDHYLQLLIFKKN